MDCCYCCKFLVGEISCDNNNKGFFVIVWIYVEIRMVELIRWRVERGFVKDENKEFELISVIIW